MAFSAHHVKTKSWLGPGAWLLCGPSPCFNLSWREEGGDGLLRSGVHSPGLRLTGKIAQGEKLACK